MLKKFYKSRYTEDSLLLKLIYLVDNKLNDEEEVPTRVDYIEKKEIDRSTLYSFDGPFQLIFYDEIKNKCSKKTMRLQVDNEFQQVKIKYLNDKNNVEVFTTSVRGGKTFAAEQKIRELKSRIAKLNAQKLKISPTKINSSFASNMNSVKNMV